MDHPVVCFKLGEGFSGKQEEEEKKEENNIRTGPEEQNERVTYAEPGRPFSQFWSFKIK